MGRYITGSFEYKFWFGSQPSDDILEFAKQDESIHCRIDFEDLKEIKTKVIKFKADFKEQFGIEYKDFMKKINKKGYLSSSDDAETNTTTWEEMSRCASRIQLGLKCIKELNEQKDTLYLEAEC
jgi:hypothetical protein